MEKAKLNTEALGKWAWVGRYLAVVAISLGLASILGHTELFQKTTMGGKLSAAHLVEFLGVGVALVMLWLLGREATIVLQKQKGTPPIVQHLILPLVSLCVVALAYSVLVLLLKPFMSVVVAKTLNWIFIVLILACSGWLIMAVFNQSTPITTLLTRKKK
jgi:hypothetical protein